MNENNTPNENDTQNAFRPYDDLPPPPLHNVENGADQQTRARLMQEAADASERAGAGIEVAFEKAAELDRLFVRFSEMAATPKERAVIDRFLESMRQNKSNIDYDVALLLAKYGREPEKNAEIVLSQKRIEAKLDQIAANQATTAPYLAGVPAVVEQANENTREGMGELYRVLYAPGFTPKQKAIADAMRQTNNHVRQTESILRGWGWKGVSPGRVSIELGKMDRLFADANMTNPFASREHNRARPVIDTTYSKRKIDSDDPDSAVEIVPNRPGGYSRDETEGETPRNT